MHRDGPARDDEVQQFRVAPALDGDFHLGAFCSAQMFAYPIVGDLVAVGNRVIYLDDLVAGQQAHLLGRAIDNHFHHIDGVLDELESNANAVKRANQRLVHGLYVFLGNVSGVRVQLLEHGYDSFVRHRIKIHRIHIHQVDGVYKLVHLGLVGLVVFVRILCKNHRQTANTEQKNAEKSLFHFRVIF